MSPKPPNPPARPPGKPRATTTEPKKKDGPKRAGTGAKTKRGEKPRKNRKLCGKHRRADAKRKKKASQREPQSL